VERVLARCLGDILVGADTGCLEGLRAQLLVLIRDKVTAEGELVNGGTLSAEIENSDLWTSKYMSDERWRKKTLESGTPRLYRDLGYGLFLQ